jgi:dipeptidyl aminopeptidase/acylaminoacyl peptidase
MNIKKVMLGLMAAVVLTSASVSPVLATDATAATASIEDAIRMVRIQYGLAPDNSVAAISPDGMQAVFTTWRGDLARNTNVYELRLVDLRPPLGLRDPRVILTRLYPGDRLDQLASPIGQLRFVQEGKALAYLGLDANGVAQAYVLDVASGQERQLTHHPSAVRSFTVDGNGKLLAFSAVAYPEDLTVKRLEEDGVFLWDPTLFPSQSSFSSASTILMRMAGWNGIRQYFLADGDAPRLFFDSRQSLPAEPPDRKDPSVATSPMQSLADDSDLNFGALTSSPDGARLLLYPYQLTNHPLHPERYAYYAYPSMNAYSRRVAPAVGVVDMATGGIEALIDAPSPQFESYESGPPLWSPDGRSVIFYTLFPDRPADPPAWVEVDVKTRRISPLGLPKDWKPIGWAQDARTLILDRKGVRFGTVARATDGQWGTLVDLGGAEGFDSSWTVATNGKIVIGVKDGLHEAPEVTAYNLTDKQSARLTDLNPQLRQRRFGEIVPYHWRSTDTPASAANGFLIKPVDYKRGRRYPLVILLDDGTLRRDGEPYLLDAAMQLSGHAIQMLAAQGFMVLYTREPSLRGVMQTPEEGERIRKDTEAAVAKLDREGLIDREKIGVSGWSRAGFHADYLLIHSSIRFAAATNIDGGASNYTDHMHPFTDGELKRIHAPMLFEPHGLWSLVYHGTMADRMSAMGKPTEILYFDAASHSTTRPQHRLRSLGTNVDWWRFWLKNEEDPDPAKAAQYAHWRELREMQQKNGDATAGPKQDKAA